MSGYLPCACRDCFEIAIGETGAMCHECETAGCELDSECQAPDAYEGGDPPREFYESELLNAAGDPIADTSDDCCQGTFVRELQDSTVPCTRCVPALVYQAQQAGDLSLLDPSVLTRARELGLLKDQ